MIKCPPKREEIYFNVIVFFAFCVPVNSDYLRILFDAHLNLGPNLQSKVKNNTGY